MSCFKLLSLGVICYITIENLYVSLSSLARVTIYFIDHNKTLLKVKDFTRIKIVSILKIFIS